MSIKTTLKKISPENWVAMILGIIGGAIVAYSSGMFELFGILLLMWGNNVVQIYSINKELAALDSFINSLANCELNKQ